MDYSQAKAILDKYGMENCIQIIFDNGRVWNLIVPKLSDDPKERKRGIKQRDEETGRILYEKVEDLIEFDVDTDSIKMREYQHGVDMGTRDLVRWEIVNPIEGIQGFNFFPEDATDDEKYWIRTQWDPTIV